MAWFTRFTRYLDVHYCYGQEAGMNCGPASVLMCVRKINKLSNRAATVLENDVRKMYGDEMTSYTPTQRYDGAAVGTAPEGLVKVLNKLSCGTWKSEVINPIDVAAKVIDVVGVIPGATGPTVDVNPLIMAVDWDGGGAHWIVVDTIRKVGGRTYATICDPWDANVHIQEFKKGAVFSYNAKEESHFDFGDDVDLTDIENGVRVTKKGKHFNHNPSHGVVKTWAMIYRTSKT